MKYNKSLIILMIFAVIACISMAGSVSAADTNNTTINSTNTTPNTAIETNATGQSSYKGPQTNTTKWNNSELGSYTKVTVTKNGTIYLVTTSGSSAGGILYALNPDGTLMWSFDTGFLGAPVKGSPVIGNDGTIYFVVEGNLYAMNTNGTQKWLYHTGTTGSISTPIIDSKGIIYFTSANNVYAIDTTSDPNGNDPKWTYSITGDLISSGAALSADGKTLYFGTHTNGLLYAINTADGSMKWNYTTGEIDNTPVVGPDGTIYVGTYTGVLYAIIDSGNQATVKWNPTIKTFKGASIALSKEGIIYIGCYKASDNFYAVNSSDGTVKYSCTLTGAIDQTAVIGSDGTIYIGTIKGILYALNPDLTIKWSYNAGGRFYDLTIGPDGTLYIPNSGLYTFQDLIANFTITPGANPLNCTFHDNSSNIPTSWSWDFGDGNTSTEQNPTHKYADAGTYTVILTVTNANGVTNTTTQTITVTKDTTAPTVTANPAGGSINSSKTVTLTPSENATIYYTLNGTTPNASSSVYNGPINITATTTLKYIAVDASDNWSTAYTQNYTLDTKAPTASTSVKTGTYNTNKIITLKMSEAGTIYYTLNGTTPTTKSTKYTGPITITSTKTLKYIAVDTAGNKSPIYTTKYTIDKTAPKISSFYPKSSTAGVSRTNTLYVKFSESIKAGTNWSKIYVKNLKTGKKVAVSKSISSNILYLKTGARTSYTWYQIYIPYAAVKDVAGNNLAKSYAWKFKTGTAATTVLDKGSKTIYGNYTVSHNDARIYSSTPKSVCSWTTYKYSNYSVKMVFTKDRYKYYEGKFVYFGTSKYTVYITKASSSTVKVVQYKWYSETGKTTTYTGYWKINGGNAVNFYKSSTFKTNYLNMYLKY